ncbi:DM13 domain-containing protein [Ectobacillus antri]|uniref:DM13 domain-containing protein n=1 Tax=Ectobacillus antri TaxID=2486280 RepID=A0ABT6H7U7_9BACI|nr:DM13 domain-containing protein [Ectobacillus antri]MDG4657343.1 DM13 domain-containing protein [Ectobacillus antri]MDG5754526.1 DM13 domain-containing protein [Ectobacillus antri]
MKKWLAIVVLVVCIPVGWWLLSPLWINKEVNEELPTSTEQATAMEEKSEVIVEQPKVQEYTGMFVDGDKTHHAAGKAYTLTQDGKRFIRFEDFNTTNGPDLYVYMLDKSNEIAKGINLGKLKGNQGNQNYELPSNIDMEKYDKVIIWCKAFDVTFGTAELKEI